MFLVLMPYFTLRLYMKCGRKSSISGYVFFPNLKFPIAKFCDFERLHFQIFPTNSEIVWWRFSFRLSFQLFPPICFQNYSRNSLDLRRKHCANLPEIKFRMNLKNIKFDLKQNCFENTVNIHDWKITLITYRDVLYRNFTESHLEVRIFTES